DEDENEADRSGSRSRRGTERDEGTAKRGARQSQGSHDRSSLGMPAGGGSRGRPAHYGEGRSRFQEGKNFPTVTRACRQREPETMRAAPSATIREHRERSRRTAFAEDLRLPGSLRNCAFFP